MIRWVEGVCIPVGAGNVRAEQERGRRYWLASYKLSRDEFCSAEEAIRWVEART